MVIVIVIRNLILMFVCFINYSLNEVVCINFAAYVNVSYIRKL